MPLMLKTMLATEETMTGKQRTRLIKKITIMNEKKNEKKQQRFFNTFTEKQQFPVIY